MIDERGTIVRELDGRWAPLCWLCWNWDINDGRPGYQTPDGAMTALRNHWRGSHAH